MPVGQNPRQAVGECCYLVGLRGICLISEILALYPPVEIFSCRGLAGRLPQYFKQAIVNLIAIVIEKFAYGLSYQVGSQYTSLAQRAADYEN